MTNDSVQFNKFGFERGCSKHEFEMFEVAKLLQQTPRTSFIATAGLCLLTISVVYPYVSAPVLAIWYALLIITFCLRMLVSARFNYESEKEHIESRKWLTLFRLSTVLTGWVWAIGSSTALYLIEGFSSYQYLLMTFLLTGFFTGAVLALSVDKKTMLVSALPSLVPMYWAFSYVPQSTKLELCLAYGVFILFVVSIGLRNSKNIRENIKLRFRAVEDEKRLELILNDSPVATSISSLDNDAKLFSNQAFKRMIERYSSCDAVLSSIMPLLDYQAMIKQLEQQESINNKLIPLKDKESESTLKWVLASFSRFDYAGQPAVLSWFYDITDRKRMEDEVKHLAHHDVLTGLPNRYLFNDRLNKMIQHAKRDNAIVGLMFVDLDNFKPVNDTLGHDVGDSLLIAVANRMTAQLREADTVARLGGDEFAVILEVTDSEMILEVAEKLRASIQETFFINQHPITISCSIGLAVYPDQAQTSTELLINADRAMYQVKQSGRNDIAMYKQHLSNENETHLT